MKRPKTDILSFIQNVLHEQLSPAQQVFLEALYALPPSYPKQPPGEWLALQTLDALYGLPTSWDAQTPYTHFTQRTTWPHKPFRDAAAICGRRSGKTGRLGVNVALYEAICGAHEQCIGKRERAHVVLMAQSLRAVNEAMLLCKAKIADTPMLAAMLEGEPTANEIRFRNRMVLSIWPCTFTAIRGLSIPVCIMDEVGVWDVEGVNPDREVVAAVRPAMATFKRPLLLKLSTPFAKAGVLWDDYERYYAREDAPCLVWRAPTWYMNPIIEQTEFVQEHERNPEIASREFGAEFADPEGAFLPYKAIKAAVDEGVVEREPVPGRYYVAAVDVALKTDSTVLAVCHREEETVVLDIWREWKPAPGKPLQLRPMLAEIAHVLKPYAVRHVVGDQYVSSPVAEALREDHGITFAEIAFTARRWKRETPDSRREVGASKVDIYNAMKTLLLQSRLRLVDQPAGIGQLRWLETWRSRTGVEQIGCPRGKHDDFPAALALAVWQVWRSAEWRPRAVKVERTGPLLTQLRVTETEGWDETGQPADSPLYQPQEDQPGPLIGSGMRWYGKP